MVIFKDFSDALVYNLSNFETEYPSFIDCGPNLFKLLCDLLDYDELDKGLRLEVCAAIAYYVVPNDVIPEEIYGPYGYIDDIFISVYVLRKVADSIGYDRLQEIWEYDNNIKEVMDECYENSIELLDDKLADILHYVGVV